MIKLKILYYKYKKYICKYAKVEALAIMLLIALLGLLAVSDLLWR